MKTKRILSILLCLVLVSTVALTALNARAATGDSQETGDGLQISKTAVNNGDGTYTITLEAFATGAKTTTTVTKSVPTDIVLVLDLSSSMKENIGTVTYTPYYNVDNEDLYEERHNGGGANLWYEDEDGARYSVSVIAEGRVPNTKDGSQTQNRILYNTYREVLYAKVNGAYVPVTVTRSGNWYSYTYTYTLTETGEEIGTGNGAYNSPVISGTDDKTIYYADGVDTSSATYTYVYTDSTGAEKVIITCTGGSNEYASTNPVLYSRTTSTSGGGTRLAALQTACKNFADAVAAKCTTADGNTVDHRIAIVGFNKTSTRYTGTSNATALLDMSVSENVTTVENKINSLATSQGTVPATGLSTANDIFAANPISEGETRNRVVVLFTDGYPSTSGSSNFDSTLANNAITQANTLKNTYGATVYTVAVLSGADPTSAGNENGTNAEKVNWYLQTTSSNNGTPQTPSYYLSASDADSLNNIFQQISQQIETGGSATTLDSKTVIKDIISEYFTLPAGASSSSITLNTYACTGYDATTKTYTFATTSSGNGGASATVQGDQVSVTGFNFSENWCGLDNGKVRGSKLVISFVVEPKDNFLGGNNVPTNASAGVYESDTATDPVKTFDVPTVNVEVPDVKVKVSAQDKNVYLMGGLTADQLKEGAVITVGTATLDLTKTNYGLSDWQKEFIKEVTVKVYDADGNEVMDKIENLKDDTTYSINVTVTPNPGTTSHDKGDAATAATGVDKGNINVFLPELTFKDSAAYYGEDSNDVNFTDNKVGDTTWSHDGTASTADGLKIYGDAPTLTLGYTVDSSALADGKFTKQDAPVKVTVKIGAEDVTKYASFLHQDCGSDVTCSWEDTDDTKNGNPAFLIHMNTCQLTITKTGGASDESYTFTVYKDGAAYSEVTIYGNGSETLYELPVGTYSIKEDTGWSWRYTASDSRTATLSASVNSGSIVCTNTQNSSKIYWLNGFSEVARNIIGGSN